MVLTHILCESMTRKFFQIRFFPFSFKNNTNAIAQTAMINSKPGVDFDFDIEIDTVIEFVAPSLSVT